MELTPEQELQLSKEKIEKVKSQMAMIRLGASQSIDCPYCGEVHNQGEQMCRKLMLCILAILNHEEYHEHKEMAERIGEKVAAN